MVKLHKMLCNCIAPFMYFGHAASESEVCYTEARSLGLEYKSDTRLVCHVNGGGVCAAKVQLTVRK